MAHTSEHRARTSARLSSVGRRFFDLIEFDDNEELVKEIRKHPFGLVLIEVIGFLIAAIVMVAGLLLSSNWGADVIGESVSSARPIILVVTFILSALIVIITIISSVIYRSNVIFVTTEKIAQVIYTSIISRKISQLSIGDVQDVSVAQNGIIARLFNYGTLTIETAGEQQNYTFTYVPDPYESSQSIVYAHEENMKRYGN
jgi:uncharacterized membrane protein YdbT with pleckstrin-like domain